MGNVFANKPTSYSDQTKFGQTNVFGVNDAGSYMAAYRQNSATADSMNYGNTKLQMGVKILQDVDPGPMQGQMYVVNNANKRLYITYKGQLAPYASEYVQQGKNYGNGPAVSITGSPLNPQYHMFYAHGGDMHKGTEWSPIQINSTQDVNQAMRSGASGLNINTGKYSNMYGMASINPFGAKEGADVWTNANTFSNALDSVLSKTILPMGEAMLDSVTGGLASTVLGVTGINKSLQSAIDTSVANRSKDHAYQSSSNFDPEMSNLIHDPRLPNYLTNLENQSQVYTKKFGPEAYLQTNKLAQETGQQQLEKAQQLAKENYDGYVHSQMQTLADTSAKLQQMVGDKTDSDIFQNIKTGLAMATTNEQRMNVVNHFSKQLQQEILPLVGSDPVAPPSSPVKGASDPSKDPIVTASAQPGHPSLSINGTDSRHPGQTVISGTPGVIPPFVPG